jgi:hypothetical protein
MKPLNREQLQALPPVTNLPTLGQAFGISEPVVRERHRQGEFERMGIRILRLGAQWRVVTADILHVLGVEPTAEKPDPHTPAEPDVVIAKEPDSVRHPAA